MSNVLEGVSLQITLRTKTITSCPRKNINIDYAKKFSLNLRERNKYYTWVKSALGELITLAAVIRLKSINLIKK